MASKQRARARTARRVTAVGVATATVTALVLGAAPTPRANATPPPGVALAAGAPDPALIRDVTFGLGPLAYDRFQALGLDPGSAINAALGTLLTQALTVIPVDLSGVPARDEQKEIQKVGTSAQDGVQTAAGADRTDESIGKAGGKPTG